MDAVEILEEKIVEATEDIKRMLSRAENLEMEARSNRTRAEHMGERLTQLIQAVKVLKARTT